MGVRYSLRRGPHSFPCCSPANTAARVQKVSRQTVSLGMTSEEWSYFLTRWRDYVEATKVLGDEKIMQLLECCDKEHPKDLTIGCELEYEKFDIIKWTI